MKTCRSFKFATEFDNLFKLERKKTKIGTYLIIQKYEMTYVLKQVLGDTEFIFVESVKEQSDDNQLMLNAFTTFAIIYLGNWLFSKTKRNFISSFVIRLSCTKETYQMKIST